MWILGRRAKRWIYWDGPGPGIRSPYWCAHSFQCHMPSIMADGHTKRWAWSLVGAEKGRR